jgi:hypothetical protein
MPRMRHFRACADARTGCEGEARSLANLLERKRIELRRDLALEPRPVALARMLARPAAIAAMSLADRLAARAIHRGAAAQIIAGRDLCPFLWPFASGLTERLGHFCNLLSYMRRQIFDPFCLLVRVIGVWRTHLAVPRV